jgi:D-xylose transport system substrate-binding protein
MRFSRKAVAVLAAASFLLLAVACGDDSDDTSNATTTAGGSGTTGEGSSSGGDLTPASFTSDFSAMEQLKDLASQGEGMIAVLLPDTTTSARYESFDRPYLQQAFEAAGLSSDDFVINNAQGSASTMQTQAEAAITQGASVLIIDPLDSGSGAAIEANAASKGVGVIDYDRLTLGGTDGRVYVSFDNVGVGKLIGEGEVQCITDWNVADPKILVMNGNPTDNNAKLFAEGYNGVLQPKFDDGSFTKVAEPAGTWIPAEAQTIFEQQLTAHPEINAVITPNDDNANAVISVLQRQGVQPESFPTTGQDASISGLQNILKGYQCGTVYKPIYLEAQAAAAAALYLRAGQDIPSSLLNSTTEDTEAGNDVPSIYLTPIWVTAENMADTVVKDGAVNVSELCVAAVAAACTAAGIQ